MSHIPTDPASQGGIDVGALAHALAGISAVVLGGLMFSRPRAQDVFSILMIVAAVSAVYFSWKHSAWVTGNGSLVGDGAGNGCDSGLSGMAVGLYPRLRDFVDRFYSLCYSGRAVAQG